MGQLLYDKASLVNIPSRYKDGKLYNIKPSNADFEFERGTGATRVNEDGLIETFYGEVTNLLLQSNQFDTTWTGEPRTGGFEGYDGSNDGWKITKSAQSYTSIQQTASLSGVWTLSAYLKSDTLNDITFRNQSDGTRCDFDLLNGVVGFSGSNVISKNITDVGNGWYRCQATFTGSSSQIAIYVAWNNATAGSVFIQDAQLESGYFATPYIETTTETVTAPNRGDTPRIDYTDSNNPSLLLEPERTNLITYSWDTNTWAWGKDANPNNTTRDFGYSAPDGSNNGTLFTSIQGTNGFFAWGNIPTGVNTDYTYSIFVKKGTSETFELHNVTTNPQSKVIYNFNTNTFTTETNATGKSVEYINGWYRISMTYPNSTQTVSQIRNKPQDGKSVYVFGAQAEEGSYATSYIPTNGGTETRNADVCIGGGDADTFNDSEGVLFLDVENVNANSTISISDDSSSNFIQIYLGYTSSNPIRYRASSGGASQFDTSFSYSLDVSQPFKIAYRYSANNFSIWINGVKANEVLSGSTPIGLSVIEFYNIFGAGNKFDGNVKALAYFPEALEDHQLERLTSPTPLYASSFEDLANNNGYTIL